MDGCMDGIGLDWTGLDRISGLNLGTTWGSSTAKGQLLPGHQSHRAAIHFIQAPLTKPKRRQV